MLGRLFYGRKLRGGCFGHGSGYCELSGQAKLHGAHGVGEHVSPANGSRISQKPFRSVGSELGPGAEKSGQESVANSHKLPEAEDPFRTEDGLPDRRKLDCQHDDAGQQGYRQ
jgi:hypothetical protein